MHRRSAPMAPKEGRASHSGTRSTAKQSVPKSHSSATARKSTTTYSMNRVTGMLTSAADDQRQSWRETYVARKLSMFSIAFLMDLCLMSAEPHRSGFGGMSTAVFLESPHANCTVLDTFNVLGMPKFEADDKCLEDLFKKFSNEVEMANVLLPGEAKLVLELIKKIPEVDFETVKEKLEQLLKFKLPVSYALHNSIKSHATRLVMDNESLSFFNSEEEYRPLAEGEFMKERPQWKKRILEKLAISSNLESFIKEMEKVFEEFLYKCQRERGFGFTEVLTTDFEADKKGDLFSPNSAERICVAKDLKTELLKNETLNIFGEVKTQHSHKSITTGLFTVLKNFYEKTAISTRESPSLDISPKLWNSNMFVIFDNKRKSAFAYVGSLGSEFGTGVKTKDGFYLNNIAGLHQVTKDREIETTKLIPFITFQPGKEISLVYAQRGGSAMHTLSLPRTLSIMQLRHLLPNMTIDQLLVYPFIYPVVDSSKYIFTQGIPYMSFIRDYFQVDGNRLYDEIVAVERRGPRPIRGRFAAKTPTQSKGFPGVQPTETPTSGSSSGTTVQGTKTTATRRTKILQQSLPTLILPFIKIAIFVSAMVIIGLVFFVVIMMVVRNLHAKGAWESHQYPAEVHFSEIAVSTTSQECNEMARVMVSEGFNIFAIAFAMQLCLSLAEPQRSGFGGAATAVLVEGGKKGCQIIDGFWDTRKKKLFKQITEEERMNKLFTTKRLAESILLPSDTSVARFFLGYLDSDEIDRLADFLKMYKLEYQPVRLSLQRAIEYDPLWLLHSKDLARFFKNDEQMRTLKEGDIVESENFGEYFLAQKSYIQEQNFAVLQCWRRCHALCSPTFC